MKNAFEHAFATVNDDCLTLWNLPSEFNDPRSPKSLLEDQQPLLPQSLTQNARSASSSTETTSLLIDVRSPTEFEEVHIPEARNIPLPDLHQFVEELKGLSQEHPLTLMCRTHNWAKIAHEYLTSNGVDNCRILEGDITDWLKSGKPVIRGRKGISLESQVRAIAGSLVVLWE